MRGCGVVYLLHYDVPKQSVLFWQVQGLCFNNQLSGWFYSSCTITYLWQQQGCCPAALSTTH